MEKIVIDIEDREGNTICGLIIDVGGKNTKIKTKNLSLADAFEEGKLHEFRLQMEEEYSDSVVECL